MKRYRTRLSVLLLASVVLMGGAALTFPEGRHNDVTDAGRITPERSVPRCACRVRPDPWHAHRVAMVAPTCPGPGWPTEMVERFTVEQVCREATLIPGPPAVAADPRVLAT